MKWNRKKQAPSSGESAALLHRLRRELLKTSFLLAALVAVAISSVAWFVANTRVEGDTASVSAQASTLRLATKGERQTAELDYLRIPVSHTQPDGSVQTTQAPLPEGQEYVFGTETYYYTDNAAIALRLAGDNASISPGAHGEVTFYIIPTRDGTIQTTVRLVLAGYHREDSSDQAAERVDDEPLDALLSGHILLFENYDPKTRKYSGWLGNPDSRENSISIHMENARQGEPREVTFHWIWPLRYENMEGSLFPRGSGEYGDIFAPWLREQSDIGDMNAFHDLAGYRYNRIFLANTAVEKDLTNPVYANDAYNRADEYIGTHADYLYLSVQTYAPQ